MELVTKTDAGLFPLKSTEFLTENEKKNIIQITAIEPGDNSGLKLFVSLPELWQNCEVIKYNDETKDEVIKTYPIFDEAMNKELLVSRILTMLAGLSGMPGVPKGLAWQIVMYFKYDKDAEAKFTLVRVYRGVADQKGSTWADPAVKAAVALSLAVPHSYIEHDREATQNFIKKAADTIKKETEQKEKEEKKDESANVETH